jgi:HTH-type transcriptional regulator / antitoxin HigA
MEIKPIRTEDDYEQALDELTRLMDEGEDTTNLDKVEILSVLIGVYEAENYPAEKPHPVEAIQYYMESRGISRTEFSRQIGIPAHRLGEILNLRRPLSINMIRTIHEVTGISADVLLQPYAMAELVTT